MLKEFYTTPRLAMDLNDGGGPFGFDIHKAYEVCTLINDIDASFIIETGSNTGDTTEFLAKLYPTKTIITCDINNNYFNFAKERLAKYRNVTVHNVSSVYLINNIKYPKDTLFYLDAHENGMELPLRQEIKSIKHGIIAIDDFNINAPGYAYEPEINIDCIKGTDDVYTNNPLAKYPFPLLQRSRRCGRAYPTKKVKANWNHEIFKKLCKT